MGVRTPTIHGVPVAVSVPYVDRAGFHHRLVAAGPFLRCLDHTGRLAPYDDVRAAVGFLAQASFCERHRIMWQRLVLADHDPTQPLVRMLPDELLAYLADQARRHADRLDDALGPIAVPRLRKRWHTIGWRAAPTLAGRYHACGVEPGVALLALRHRVKPERVERVMRNRRHPMGAALHDIGPGPIKLLNLGLHEVVTEDFPYERLVAPRTSGTRR
jgi:hypothetical protein